MLISWSGKTGEGQDGDDLARLKSEFRALAGVHHHNLVHLDELFVGDDGWFFTMELAEGVGLAQWVRSAASVEERNQRLRDVARDLASALDTLHRSARLHLDVKPNNVCVTRDGRLVVLDFGLSRSLSEQRDGGRRSVGGTVAYMAPEQLEVGPVGTAADWYAFGSTMFELLTGAVPFPGDSNAVAEAKRRGDTPRTVHSLAQAPPPDLAGLVDDLLSHDASARPAAPEVLSALDLAPAPRVPPSPATPLFGRDREMEVIREGLASARADGPLVLRIEGESGLGKTALLREAEQMARLEGALTLSGRCRPREWVPFKAFDGLVDNLVDHLASLRPARQETLVPVAIRALMRLFPGFERLRAFARANRDAAGQSMEALDDASLRRDGFEALDWLLDTLRGPRSLVLLLDDVQWADRDSLALLRFLLRTDRPRPLAVVMASRPGAPAPALGGVRVEDLTIGPLAPEAAQELIAALARGSAADVAQLAALSDGRPLWCRALARDGPPAGGGVDALFAQRVCQQTEVDRRLLELLSLLARPVPTVLAALLMDDVDIVVGLDRLALEGLVIRSPAGGGEAWQTAHAKVGEAALQPIDSEGRQERHLALANVLIADGAPMDEVAEHLLAAGDTERGARYAVSAAEMALHALEFGRAARLLELAIELEDVVPRRCYLRERLGEILACDARGEEAARVYLAAVEDAPSSRVERLKYLAAEQLMRSGRIDEGRARLESLLEGHGFRPPRSGMAALASFLWHRGRVRRRGTEFVPVEASAVPPEVLARIDAAWSAGATLALVDAVTAASFQAQGLLKALDVGEPSRVARALGAESVFRAVFGDDVSAEALWRQNREVVEAHPSPVDRGGLAIAGSVGAYQRGDWERCYGDAVAALGFLAGQRANMSWIRSTALIYRFAAAAHLGRLSELRAELPRELDAARDRGDLHALLHLSLGMPVPVAAICDRPDEGAANAEEAWRNTPGQAYDQLRVHYLRTRAELALYRGDAEQAEALGWEGWRMVERSPTRRVRVIRSWAGELAARGLIAAAAQSGLDRARRGKLAQLRAALVKYPEPWVGAIVAMIDAQCRALSGESSEALALFDRASRSFADAGMRLYELAAIYRRGQLLSGAGGREDRRTALAALRVQGVAAPQRLIRMVAPLNPAEESREGGT